MVLRKSVISFLKPCLSGACIFGLFYLWGQPKASAAEGRKPNVLVFMTDDIGYGDIHAFNPQNNHSPTPNLDELAATGISFHHAHSPASLCAPTRYALLTGNHVYRGRRANGTWTPFDSSQITADQETLAYQLNKKGYRTSFFGKVHLGGIFRNAQEQIVNNFDDADLTKKFSDGLSEHGFDYSLSLPSGIQKNPFAFFKNDRLARYNPESKRFEFLTDEAISRRFKRITDEAEKSQYGTEVRGPLYAMDNYTTESVGPLLMQNALRFLDDHFAKHPDKPFYMHYMSQAGHRPYAPPLAFNVSDPLNTQDTSAPGAIRVRGITPTERTDMVYESDVAMGLFMEKLDELGQLNNTIIIYTSDNGPEVSEKVSWSDPIYSSKDGPAWYQGPYGGDRIEHGEYRSRESEKHINGQGIGLDGKALRGMKSFVYEGGHRVPLIMRWGGGKNVNSIFPPNTRVTDQFISLTDLYRTICTLAEVKVPENQALDSFDFSRLLTDPKPLSASNLPVRDYLAIQAWRVADSAPIDNKRMVWSFYSYGSDYKIWNAIISKSKNATDFSSVNVDELYLLTDDEGQSENIKDSRKALVNSLTKEFTAFLKKGATHPKRHRTD